MFNDLVPVSFTHILADVAFVLCVLNKVNEM